MKKILYSLFLVLAFVMSSCEKNVIFEDSDDFSSFVMITSLNQSINNSAVRQDGVNQGTIVYFMDCSRGIVSREWTLMSDDGYFLDDSFVDGGTEYDYSSFYMPDRTQTTANVYIEQSFRGEVNLRYKGSFLYKADYTIYDSNNDDQSIESVYNSSTGLWELTVDYSYLIYEDLDLAYVIYETDSEDIVYAYTHADEYDANYTLDLKANTDYTLEIKSTYGYPTTWEWSRFADYTDMMSVPFTTGNSGTTYNLGNISLSRSGNTVPTASKTVTLVKCGVDLNE